jgi:hypothetical protein
MAITFQKQPLNFFNVTEPAIFEWTSDADLGVNVNDLVADLELKSLYTDRRYVIKNILPNFGTGVFRVDIQRYIKSLMLDNFEYRFESPNQAFTIEAFSIGVDVRPENYINTLGDAFVFDSGYVFDETFIFAEFSPSDELVNLSFFPQIGISPLSENVRIQKDPTKLTILAPRYVEFASGFSQTLSVFAGALATTSKVLSVEGITSVIPAGLGVRLAPITEEQINEMYLPALITTSLNNGDIPVYGISYKASDCEDTLQFRFYTSYAGYSYFYTPKEALTAARNKTDAINNDFYNQQERRSTEVQRSVDYAEGLALSGNKALELQDLFKELLRSPKVEVLLPRGFTECKVRGQMNVRKLDFEYSLNVDIANVEQMGL